MRGERGRVSGAATVGRRLAAEVGSQALEWAAERNEVRRFFWRELKEAAKAKEKTAKKDR